MPDLNPKYSKEQIDIYKEIASKYNIKFEDVEKMVRAVKDLIQENLKEIDPITENLPIFHFLRFGKFYPSDKQLKALKGRHARRNQKTNEGTEDTGSH